MPTTTFALYSLNCSRGQVCCVNRTPCQELPTAYPKLSLQRPLSAALTLIVSIDCV